MRIVKKGVPVVRHRRIGPAVYDLTIGFPEAAQAARPGQFVCLYSGSGARLLPRPISICGIDRRAGTIRLVYRIAGAGTREIASRGEGETIEVMGPLGNGYEIRPEPAILIGGGIGIPPLLELARQLRRQGIPSTAVLGFRDAGTFLSSDFQYITRTVFATEDGSLGVKGTVIDAIESCGITGRQIYACGPMPMLKAVAAYARKQNLEAQISLEERMACGIGACLGCVTKTRHKDRHTNVCNARICKDGPVFDAKEVLL